MAQRQALLIGNTEYDDPNLSRLISPAADVNNLADLFREAEIGSFDEVAVLINQAAAVVRRAIAQFFSKNSRDDLLMLYFSGHGVLDDRGRLHLAVKDSERDLLSATAIDAAFITDVMDRSFSRRQVLVLDCCHSGAFAAGAKGVLGASVGTASAFEGKGYGRVVLTATDATQYAWEGDQVIGEAQNSVFTRFFIRGLQTGEADIDSDGTITLDELFAYIYERVVSLTPKQTPAKWSYKQQGEIILARNPHLLSQPVELPQELLQVVASPFASVREGAVRELEGLLNGTHKGLSLAAYTALKSMVDDDSRRVSQSAASILAAFDNTQPSREQKPKVSSPPVRLEPVPVPVESRMVMPAVDAKAYEPEPSVSRVKPGLAYLKRLTVGLFREENKLWLIPLWIGAGWAVGLFFLVLQILFRNETPQFLSYLLLLLGGAIGGGVTGLAWQRVNRSRISTRILVVSWAVLGVLSWPLGDLIVEPVKKLTDYAAILWVNHEWYYYDLAGWMLSWAVFGIGSVLILRMMKLLSSKKLAIWMIFGWAAAGFAGLFLALQVPYEPISALANTLYPGDKSYLANIVILVCLAAFLTGLMGGVMFVWQHLWEKDNRQAAGLPPD